MKREELYISIISEIAKLENLQDADLDAFISLKNVNQALNALPSNVTNKYHSIISALNDNIDDLDFDIPSCFEHKLWVEHKQSIYSRNISYSCQDFSIFDCSRLYDSTLSDAVIITLERIFAKDSNTIKEILNVLVQKNYGSNKFVITYNPANVNPDVEDLYAFALASMINEGTTLDFNNNLRITPSPLNSPSFTYNQNVKYREYHDIYIVMNEWQLSTDILTAFLKMYQILEYLVYRKLIADNINTISVRQSFTKKSIDLSNVYKKGERQTVEDGIRNLCQGIVSQLNQNNIAKAANFVSTEWKKNYFNANPTDQSIATFIYDTRCSIVHNKESELHITYFNYEVYKDIVDLLKELNQKVMIKILDIINTVNGPIHYKKDSIPLY